MDATERLPPVARPKLSWALEGPPLDVLFVPEISDDSHHVHSSCWRLEGGGGAKGVTKGKSILTRDKISKQPIGET